MDLEIYKIINKKNEFILNKNISPKTHLLLFNKTNKKNLIFNSKYTFCELNGELTFQ